MSIFKVNTYQYNNFIFTAWKTLLEKRKYLDDSEYVKLKLEIFTGQWIVIFNCFRVTRLYILRECEYEEISKFKRSDIDWFLSYPAYAIPRKLFNLTCVCCVWFYWILFAFKRMNLYKLVIDIGFVLVKRNYKKCIIYGDDIAFWRRNYLRKVGKYKKYGRDIYYLYETWLSQYDAQNVVSSTVKSKRQAFMSRKIQKRKARD